MEVLLKKRRSSPEILSLSFYQITSPIIMLHSIQLYIYPSLSHALSYSLLSLSIKNWKKKTSTSSFPSSLSSILLFHSLQSFLVFVQVYFELFSIVIYVFESNNFTRKWDIWRTENWLCFSFLFRSAVLGPFLVLWGIEGFVVSSWLTIRLTRVAFYRESFHDFRERNLHGADLPSWPFYPIASTSLPPCWNLLLVFEDW